MKFCCWVLANRQENEQKESYNWTMEVFWQMTGKKEETQRYVYIAGVSADVGWLYKVQDFQT